MGKSDISRSKRRRCGRTHIALFQAFIAGFLLICPAILPTASGQVFDAQEPQSQAELTIGEPVTNRFVAVPGRRAIVMGYPQEGLEVWAYPLQILDKYQIGFRPEGATTETPGGMLLRRLIYAPESVTRIYVGPDYIVRERIFVPLDRPTAVLSYEVEAPHPVSIVIHFTPVLNLMWPAALGGQSTEWSPAASGYVVSEPMHRWSAVIASPEVIAHDATANNTEGTEAQISFTIQPHPSPEGVGASTGAASGAPSTATVLVALQTEDGQNPSASILALASTWINLESQAATHYQNLLRNILSIHTPDDEVNSALAWAEIALDQAWVCNPKLGCGLVAGYGPSRPGRRPQYDWFFAGDGLIATNALLSAGDYARARDELEFILKYQDASTGMIWHELSQSAGYIDWSKYPYMFAHVDITFDYLTTIDRYVETTGDTQFAREHWASIAGAYRYCHSLIAAGEQWPHIPAGKEGVDEQHRPYDALSLSTEWVSAARSFAALAKLTGHSEQANGAAQESEAACAAIDAHYWDAKQNFWIDGHTATGAPIFARRSGPGAAILEKVFSQEEINQLLDQIASSKFQTDWGTRGVASDSSIYNPWSYAGGSVSALHSAQTANVFWQEDRPEIAESIWRGILPWNWLDAPGHIHEVLAGNFYREQSESVPEQTWSSAGLLDAAVQGLLGIEVQGTRNRVTFRPHLPAEWKEVSVENLALPHSRLDFSMQQDMSSVSLEVRNAGEAAVISFAPQIPLGARLNGAACDGRAVRAHLEEFGEDEHAEFEVQAPSGTTHCQLTLTGGVALILPHPTPEVGDPSVGMKLTSMHLQGRQLVIDADVTNATTNSFHIRTSWKPTAVKGATIRSVGADLFEVQVRQSTPANADASGYAQAHVQITFATP